MLDFHFVNVANGDCIIIDYTTSGGRAVGVVDCNSTGGVSPAAQKLDKLGVTELSFVCLTHPDKDHYSGLYEVLTRYAGRIGHFYTFPVGDVANNPSYIKKLAKNYRELLDTQDDPLVYAQSKELIQILMYADKNFVPDKWEELVGPCNTIAPTGFQGVSLQCLLPLKFHKGEFFEHIRQGHVGVEAALANNKISLAIRIIYGGRSVLLGGDAPEENWMRHKMKWQRPSGNSIASNLVKLPHHGSRLDCTPEVLNDLVALSGESFTVVSADGKRHPHQEVMDWLANARLRNYCTNHFTGWGGTVRDLLREPTLDPVLNRLLNEYSDADQTRSQPCKGDICVSISENGATAIKCTENFSCLCDPIFKELFQ